MKCKIVPNVFALTKEEFDKKLEIVKFSDEVHLDFMDGKFIKNLSVCLEDMNNVKKYPDIGLNIHFMAYNPLQYWSRIRNWNVKMVYIHFEVYSSESELEECIEFLKKKGVSVGIVLNPSTSIQAIQAFLEDVDSVMLMSVWPGEEGQEFIEESYARIRELRNCGFAKEIAIDGGVNEFNVKNLVQHGANTLFVGSYISSQENPEQNYEKLRSLV